MITLKCVTHCVLITLLTALHARAAAGNPDSEAATAETTVVERFPIRELFSIKQLIRHYPLISVNIRHYLLLSGIIRH